MCALAKRSPFVIRGRKAVCITCERGSAYWSVGWLTSNLLVYSTATHRVKKGGAVPWVGKGKLKSEVHSTQYRERGNPEPTSTDSSSSVWADWIGAVATAGGTLIEYK